MRSHHTSFLLLLTLGIAACGGTAATPAPRPTPTPGTSTAAPATGTPGSVALTSLNPPSPRWGAAVGYDPGCQCIVLFGGQSNRSALPHADTWRWDGSRWTALHPAHSPPGLVGAELILDPVSGHLLLVGGEGVTDSNGFPLQEGVWTWSGTDWSRAGDSPIQDSAVDAAADLATKQILLDSAGETGAGPVAPPSYFVGGGYVWNGVAWSKAPTRLTGTTTTLGAHSAGIAYDPVSRRVIEFGGTQQVALGDTLAWSGTTWSTLLVMSAHLDPTQPPPGPAMAATDSTFGHIVLVAGPLEDAKTATTWQWNGARWERLRGNEPPLMMQASIVDDPQAGGVVMFGGADATTGGPSNAVFVWRGAGWETISASSS